MVTLYSIANKMCVSNEKKQKLFMLGMNESKHSAVQQGLSISCLNQFLYPDKRYVPFLEYVVASSV
jgi:hypothetical protein